MNVAVLRLGYFDHLGGGHFFHFGATVGCGGDHLEQKCMGSKGLNPCNPWNPYNLGLEKTIKNSKKNQKNICAGKNWGRNWWLEIKKKNITGGNPTQQQHPDPENYILICIDLGPFIRYQGSVGGWVLRAGGSVEGKPRLGSPKKIFLTSNSEEHMPMTLLQQAILCCIAIGDSLKTSTVAQRKAYLQDVRQFKCLTQGTRQLDCKPV